MRSGAPVTRNKAALKNTPRFCAHAVHPACSGIFDLFRNTILNPRVWTVQESHDAFHGAEHERGPTVAFESCFTRAFEDDDDPIDVSWSWCFVLVPFVFYLSDSRRDSGVKTRRPVFCVTDTFCLSGGIFFLVVVSCSVFSMFFLRHRAGDRRRTLRLSARRTGHVTST